MLSSDNGVGRGVDRGSEQGSLIPFLAIVMLAVAMAGLLIGVTARHYRNVAEVQWAADAAALAIAAEGPDQFGTAAGRLVAAANGARLVSVMTAPRPPDVAGPYLSLVVVVQVESGGIVARAAATRVMIDASPG